MAVEGGKSVEQSLSLLREMSDMVTAAGKSWFRADMCQVNRRDFTERIDLLRECLPEAITKADEIVRADADIRQRAEEEAAATVAAAKAEADRVAEQSRRDFEAAQEQIRQAEAEAERIRQEGERLQQQLSQQAQAQAAAIVEDGRRQAQKIVDDGENEARKLVLQENIYLRAQEEAQNLTDANNQQIAQAREHTFSYLDSMLAKAEQYVGSLVQEVHQERENLNSVR